MPFDPRETILLASSSVVVDQVNIFLTMPHNNDAQKRTFVMTTLIFSAK
jgi:hypothetical protein